MPLLVWQRATSIAARQVRAGSSLGYSLTSARSTCTRLS